MQAKWIKLDLYSHKLLAFNILIIFAGIRIISILLEISSGYDGYEFTFLINYW